MPMNDPFDDAAFSMTSLTDAINILPNNYGRVGQINLFRPKPVRTSSISIEENNGVLNLLLTQTPGSPGTVGKKGKRKLRSFNIPHIPHDDIILPSEVQGIRAFGEEDRLKELSEVIAEHMQAMRDKHAITLEHLRVGALKGIILDADGSELLNLYEEFDITPKTVNFDLSNANADIKKKCLTVKRHIEKNLMGEFMNGVRALVSPEFYDAFTGHAKVKEAYERYQDGRGLRDDMRDGFAFGGIIFEEYNAEASDPDGNVRRFIADGEGHAFPMGTAQTFRTYFGPGDFNEAVNTLGRPLYAKQSPRKHNRGTDLHTQSNPLPLCLRPGVLVKLAV